MTQQPEWWEWVDHDIPGGEPIKLLKDAPEEIKKKFEEWQRQREEDRAKGIWR